MLANLSGILGVFRGHFRQMLGKCLKSRMQWIPAATLQIHYFYLSSHLTLCNIDSWEWFIKLRFYHSVHDLLTFLTQYKFVLLDNII
jgi:hypothetical protein